MTLAGYLIAVTDQEYCQVVAWCPVHSRLKLQVLEKWPKESGKILTSQEAELANPRISCPALCRRQTLVLIAVPEDMDPAHLEHFACLCSLKIVVTEHPQ